MKKPIPPKRKFSPPSSTLWAVSIGPSYQEGWNRSAEPQEQAHQCKHCLSFRSLYWVLEKEVQAFGQLVHHYSKVYECLNCGHEEWELIDPPSKKLKAEQRERAARMRQWKSIPEEKRKQLIAQFEKKGGNDK